MFDTSQNIQQKQSEIFLAKPVWQRLLIGLETIDFGYKIAETGIVLENPAILESKLKTLLFKRFYSGQFSDQKEKIIIEKIILYHEKKNQKI